MSSNSPRSAGSAARRRPGRPMSAAPGSPEAGRRLREAMDRLGLRPSKLGEMLGYRDDGRTVRRWISGEAGPDRARAQQLSTLLSDDTLLELWWAAPEVCPAPLVGPKLRDESEVTEKNPEASASRQVNKEPNTGNALTVRKDHTAPAGNKRHGARALLLLLALGVIAFIAVLVYAESSRQMSGASPQGSGAPASSLDTTNDDEAVFQANVVGTGPGTNPDDPVSLWSKPSTTTGCGLSACSPGTERVGKVYPGQLVKVVCVTNGQRIRNGVPNGSGYYEDNRWLSVAFDQNLQQPLRQSAYLSNVWYARSGLPNTLPSCKPEIPTRNGRR